MLKKLMESQENMDRMKQEKDLCETKRTQTLIHRSQGLREPSTQITWWNSIVFLLSLVESRRNK